jgi:hypothetical protein
LGVVRRIAFFKPRYANWLALSHLNLAVLAGLTLYKLLRSPLADLAYIHLLVDYHFGLIKRALIGELVGLAFGEVSPWTGQVLGLLVICAVAVLFGLVFRNRFGFSRSQLPLFVFLFGSPFFLKNFIHTIGYLDIYGCLFALAMLLLPARSFLYVVAAGVCCVILLFIHHLHGLLYVPTIAAIVCIRHFLPRPLAALNLVTGVAICLALIAACIFIQFEASVAVPDREFADYLRSRIGSGGSTDALAFTYVWYRPLSDEIRETWDFWGDHWKHWYLAYPVLLLLHWPLVGLIGRSVLSIRSPFQRRVVTSCFAAVTLGYAILFCIAFDYARFISSWAVCMMLIFLAARDLDCETVPPIALDDRTAFSLAIPLVLIPRVGIIRAFNL